MNKSYTDKNILNKNPSNKVMNIILEKPNRCYDEHYTNKRYRKKG